MVVEVAPSPLVSASLAAAPGFGSSAETEPSLVAAERFLHRPPGHPRNRSPGPIEDRGFPCPALPILHPGCKSLTMSAGPEVPLVGFAVTTQLLRSVEDELWSGGWGTC